VRGDGEVGTVRDDTMRVGGPTAPSPAVHHESGKEAKKHDTVRTQGMRHPWPPRPAPPQSHSLQVSCRPLMARTWLDCLTKLIEHLRDIGIVNNTADASVNSKFSFVVVRVGCGSASKFAESAE
jgi:hypothetical protein